MISKLSGKSWALVIAVMVLTATVVTGLPDFSSSLSDSAGDVDVATTQEHPHTTEDGERGDHRSVLALYVLPQSGEKSGLLVHNDTITHGALLDWFPNVSTHNRQISGPAPDALLDAAAADGQIRALVKVDDRSVAIQELGAGEASREEVRLGADARIIGSEIHYGVSASGVEVIGYTLVEELAPLVHTSWLHVRSPEGDWQVYRVPPPSSEGWGELRDMRILGDNVHLLPVGPSGTYYARFNATTRSFDVLSELVLLPKTGSGTSLDVAKGGRVAVLAAESQEESQLSADGVDAVGARVAVRSTEGAWTLHATGHAYQGQYGDVRLEPSLRVLLKDWRAGSNNTATVLAPGAGGEPWEHVASLDEGSVEPKFLPGTAFVVTAPWEGAGPGGYELVQVD